MRLAGIAIICGLGGAGAVPVHAQPGYVPPPPRSTSLHAWEKAWFDRWGATVQDVPALVRPADTTDVLQRFRVAPRFREMAEAGRQGDAVARMLVAHELNRRCNGGRRLNYRDCLAWFDWAERYGKPIKEASEPVYRLQPWNFRLSARGDRMHQIGRMFELGEGGPVNTRHARIAYAWGTGRGDPPDAFAESKFRLGMLHERGLGGPANRTFAYNAYKEAADLGHPMANFLMGVELARTPAEIQSAAYHFRDAGNAGIAEGAYRYAMLLYEGKASARMRKGKNDPTAAELCHAYFRKAALAGHVHAAVMVGRTYSRGLGVPADEAKAEEWWKRAARAGDAEGAFLTANAYGRRSDFPGGLPWLKRAAAGNYPRSREMLQQWQAAGWREKSLLGDLLSVVTFLGEGAAAYEQQRQAQIDYQNAQWLAAKYADGGPGTSAGAGVGTDAGPAASSAEDLEAVSTDRGGSGGMEGAIIVGEDESYKKWRAAEEQREIEFTADRARRATEGARVRAQAEADRAAAAAESERRRIAAQISCHGSVEAARNAKASCQ